MKRYLITALVSLLVGLVSGLLLGRQLPPTREQVLDYARNLSVRDLPEFLKQINAQLGVQAFPRQFFPGGSESGK